MLGSVLITGGSGSFGTAFVHRVLNENLSERICIFSRGEHAQAALRDDVKNDPRCRWFIGDVRDRDRLRRAMQGCDVVVHAAALKRIEVAVQNPVELCRTNIDGAINVIEAAQDAKVKKVVALSTDKACEPVSAYGLSKAMAECLFQAANNTVGVNGPRFAAVRYGNVWASAGSVVPRWKRILEQGGTTVPVSAPEASRFWMSLEQAVDLVLYAIDNILHADLFVPGPMPAYTVGDLAKAMDVEMDVTGLPVWEKLHESILPGLSSDQARRMSVEELKSWL